MNWVNDSKFSTCTAFSVKRFSFNLLARDVKYSLNLLAIILLLVTLWPLITKSSLDCDCTLPRSSFIIFQVFFRVIGSFFKLV